MGKRVASILAILECVASSTVVTWIWDQGQKLIASRRLAVGATLVHQNCLVFVLEDACPI